MSKTCGESDQIDESGKRRRLKRTDELRVGINSVDICQIVVALTHAYVRCNARYQSEDGDSIWLNSARNLQTQWLACLQRIRC